MASRFNPKPSLLLLLLLLLSFIFLLLPSHALDTLSRATPLADGKTLVSSGGIFELGFFNPGRSTNRYVGIWYHNFSTSTVLWVANRQNPIPSDSSASLRIGPDGNLLILAADTNTVIWSSNASPPSNQSTAQLTDTGNFVLNSSGTVSWQSFDHPTDTYLPGMKVGLNLRTNVNQLFRSWRSDDDPAEGNFSMGIDPKRSTQIFIWEGTAPRWRSGRWNGQVFIGIQNMVPQYIYGFKLSNFEQEQLMYFYYSQFNSSHRYVLTWDGIEKHLIWRDDSKYWSLFWAQPLTRCEFYNKCGNYGSCSDDDTPICRCLRGFTPASDAKRRSGDWSDGCVRRTQLQCERNISGDGKMQGVKLPDLSDWYAGVLNTSDCEQTCLSNCSCKAYSYVTGIVCLIWGAELPDIHIFSSGGNDMYLRLAGSELDEKKKLPPFVIVIIVLAAVFFLGCIYLSWKKKRRIKEILKRRKDQEVSIAPSSGREERTALSSTDEIINEVKDGKAEELPLLSFDSILEPQEAFLI